MSAIKQLLGKKTWIGALTALIISLAMDGGGALLMSRGMIPEMPAWVYGAYAIGAFIGVRIAVRGENGTLLRGLIIWLAVSAAVCIVGIAVYGGITFRGHAIGVLAGLLSGSLCGGLLSSGKSKHGKHRKKQTSERR